MAIFSFIGGAIAGALFTTAGAIALATQIISTALALGAQLALSYLNRPKKRSYAAVQGTVQIGAAVPMDMVFGTVRQAGTLRYYARYGKGNKYNTYVHELSLGPCDGLEPYVYFYGKRHELISVPTQYNETERWLVSGFGEYIIIRYYDGSAGQGPDTELVNATSELSNNWKASSVAEGRAYVVTQREYDADLFEDGTPDIEVVHRGLKQYDPRKDSTVSGGSGSHRYDDLSTYEFTKNPAIHRLTLSTGRKGLISGSVIVGVGHDISQMQIAMHMAAANVCDTLRTVGERTFKTYEASLYVTADDDHLEVLSEFEDAMAGYAVNRSGYSAVIAGAAQVPVLEITNNDIRDDAPLGGRNRNRADESINYLAGSYTSIEGHWKPQPLKAVSVNADVLRDQSKIQAENNFLQVTDPDIAQYLLNIRYRQNRKQAKRTLPVSRRIGAKVETGDWVTYEGKSWLITRRTFDAAVRFTLELSETGSDVYDEEGIDAGPVIFPSTQPANPSLIQTVAEFAIDVGFFTSENGKEIPTLVFMWEPPDDPTVDEVVIEYQPRLNAVTFGQTQYAISTDPESGRLEISNGVLANTYYRARATIRTTPDRLKNYTGWVSALSETSRLTDLTVGLSQTRDDIIGSFKDAFKRLDEMENRVDLLSGDASINNADEYLNRVVVAKRVGAAAAAIIREEQLRVSADEAIASDLVALTASVGDVESSVVSEAEARALADGALASNISIVSASVVSEADTREAADDSLAGDIASEAGAREAADSIISASVGSEALARADADGALASLINAVQAEVDDVSAEGLFSIEATAGEVSDDFLVRLSLLARASTGSAFSEAGMIIEVYEVGLDIKSRILMTADQFGFYNPSTGDRFLPVVIEDGILKANELQVNGANIKNLVVDDTAIIEEAVIKSSNIETKAVTEERKTIVDVEYTSNRSYTTIDTFSFNIGDTNTIDIFADISMRITAAAVSGVDGGIRVVRQSTGLTILEITKSLDNASGGPAITTQSEQQYHFVINPTAESIETFLIQTATSRIGVGEKVEIDGTIFARYLKK